MQLCQKEYAIGRASMLPVEPSSQEVENRIVGPRMRIARVAVQVISPSRMRCRTVNLRWPWVGLGGAGVATSGTWLFYRPGASSCGNGFRLRCNLLSESGAKKFQ